LLNNDKYIQNHFTKGINLAVILAAGTRNDFECPSGLLDIDGKQLLKRNMEILQENGISKFIIITGYKKETFSDFVGNCNIVFVENPKYKWTGSMASLACAEEVIKEDFLLLEDDILVEERALKELLANNQRDCILITDESGSGDEVYVEIKNGFINKISKDIHQIARVHGEMVGITKLSYGVYSEIVKEYKDYSNNPYMNYEYMLLDISRDYRIGYIKVSNLVWAEIDTNEQYENVNKVIYPILKRKEAHFKESLIKDYVVDALSVNINAIESVQAFGGMTNKNYKVKVNEEEYVLRIPGNGTGEMINRIEEKKNAIIASSLDIDTKLIHFDEDTGVKISKLIQNAETLTSKLAKRENIMMLTTEIFKRLHQSEKEFENRFNVFDNILKYEQLLNEANGSTYPHFEEVREQVMLLKDQYESIGYDLVPCHNDPVAENFVKSGDRLYLIDFEYSGMNDPMWDLAAHSMECGFCEKDEELFLSLYFSNQPITIDIKKKILMNKIFQDFLWTIWTCIKEAKGDNFGTYGIDRFNRARANLNNSLLSF
jgi:thiamine kinase-like enzyme/choline kinase